VTTPDEAAIEAWPHEWQHVSIFLFSGDFSVKTVPGITKISSSSLSVVSESEQAPKSDGRRQRVTGDGAGVGQVMRGGLMETVAAAS
jgi:hypothetical protein